MQALEAVHEAAHELGMSEEAAGAALTAGILDAAEASGEEALRSVIDALPDELVAVAEAQLQEEAASTDEVGDQDDVTSR